MSEMAGQAAPAILLLAWPVIAGVATYRRDRRQFWRGMMRVAIFLTALVGLIWLIAGYGLAGLGY